MVWACQEVEGLTEDTVKRRADGESQHSFPATFAIAGFPSPTTSQIRAKERERKKPKRKASKAKSKRRAASRG
jgi:hypothetical protein